jgi:peptide deformylase
MAIKKVLTYPNPLLRKVARPVSEADLSSEEFLDALRCVEETLSYLKNGAALACPQVGLSVRAFVVCPAYSTSFGSWFFNPVIELAEGREKIDIEGCLSFPNVKLEVTRHETVVMSFDDITGNRRTLRAEGFVAKMWQHEVDHLDGKLFIDGYSENFKNRIAQKLSKEVNGNVR